MSQSDTQIVFGYWAIRGLAEPSRLALHYTKTPYTEKFYYQGDGPEFSREDWLKEKFNLGLGLHIEIDSYLLNECVSSLSFRLSKFTISI